MKYLITGIAGFIGSNLALRLLAAGHDVVGVDKKPANDPMLDELWDYDYSFSYKQFHIINNSLLGYGLDTITNSISKPIDFVFHLAANADIRFSAEYPEKDLDGIFSTHTILEWMHRNGIKNIAYASSAAMYGDAPTPTPEYWHPTQTSFYGASKAACEAWIEAAVASWGGNAWIFRFSSIIGEGYSHGFIYNFYKKLKEDPTKLYVHGGKGQAKAYLYVQDCISGMLSAIEQSHDAVNTFNLGHDHAVGLEDTIPIITKHMKVDPVVVWSGNLVGWQGDSLHCLLDTTKLKKLGWRPRVTISDGIKRTLVWLDANPWALKRGEI